MGGRAVFRIPSLDRVPPTEEGFMDLSAGSLFASLMVSTVGFGFFRYGKSATRTPHLLIGLGLMVFPYFVPSPWWMIGIAVAAIGLLVLWTRAGG